MLQTSSRTAGRPSFRPPFSVSDGWKNQHHALILSGRWKRTPEIAETVRLSVGLCFIILTENFRVRRRLSEQFIPRPLTFEQKVNRPTAHLRRPFETSWIGHELMKWSITKMGRGYTGTRFRSEVAVFTAKVEIILKTAKNSAERIKCEDYFLFPSSVGVLCVICFFEEIREWIKSIWPNFTFYIFRATNQQIKIQVGMDSL
jgi:hypothetical protein